MINYPVKITVRNTDPQHMEFIAEMLLNRQLHRGLTRLTADLKVAPDMAETIDVANEGKTYIFRLKNATFTDGTKLVAGDVVSTFRRMFATRSAMASDFALVKGATKALKDPKQSSALGITALGEKMVKFELTEPSALFLIQLSLIDASIIKVLPDSPTGKDRILGLGSYSVASITDQETVLVPRKDAELSNQGIRLVKVDSDQEAIELAKTGKLDSLENIDVGEAKVRELETLGWRKTVTSSANMMFLIMNPKKVSKEVRAMVRDAILSSHELNAPIGYQRQHGLIPNVFPGALSANDVKLNPAPKLNGKITVALKYEAASPLATDLANQVKKLLNQCEILLVPFKTEDYVTQLEKADFEIVLVSKGLEYPDGLSILSYFKSDLKSNYFFVHDKSIDRDLKKAASDPSVSSRVGIYRGLQQKILAQNTLVPLVSGSSNLGLWSNRVSGIEPHPLGPATLDFTLLSKKVP